MLRCNIIDRRGVIVREAIEVHVSPWAHRLPPWRRNSVDRQPRELSVKVVRGLAVDAVVSAWVQRCWYPLAVGLK